MILPVHDALRAHVARLLTTLYSLDAGASPAIVLEYPPKRELGDLATPVAFELARRLRKAPRAIAQEIASALGAIDGVTRVEAAPNGYLNIYLDRAAFVRSQVGEIGVREPFSGDREENGSRTPISPGKTIIEHTAINPNKA